MEKALACKIDRDGRTHGCDALTKESSTNTEQEKIIKEWTI
jgi:hypothetical protein